MYKITEIWTYPVKGLAGISLKEATVELRGLQYDRRWMVVDENGQFVSQRGFPKMALIGTAIEGGMLRIFDRKQPENGISVSLDLQRNEKDETTMVEVWSSRCRANRMDTLADEWLSEMLSEKVRLVSMPDQTKRPTDGRYAPAGQLVSFADAMPYLFIGQSSLDDLNRRLPDPIPMNRFRPNIVFEGGQPHEEDHWSDFRVGDVSFRGVKNCGRCVVTTTDQDTGVRNAEPLKTLATYRKRNNSIYFGQYAIWTDTSAQAPRVKVGDYISLLA